MFKTMNYRRNLSILALAFLLLFRGLSPAWAVEPLFGAPATSAEGDPFFEKNYGIPWQRVVNSERARPSFTAQGEILRPHDAEQWRNLVARSGRSHELDLLRMVNGYFNQWRPKSDDNAWHTPEYWATPGEFMAQRGGDCEDYAIAKYYALRFLGVPAARMRVVVVRQLDAKGEPLPQLHAILAVQARDSWFILDSNARPRDGIFPHSQYNGRFMPLYSVNEAGAFKHCTDPLRH